MKKYIILHDEIVEAGDNEAIDREITWLRDWAKDDGLTIRYPSPVFDSEKQEETSEWVVRADNHGQVAYVTNSFQISGPFNTESEAKIRSDKLNDEIDKSLRDYILQNELSLPNSVEHIYLGEVEIGKYPQSRFVKVILDFFCLDSPGSLEITIPVYWTTHEICDRDIHPQEVAEQVSVKFKEYYEKARDEFNQHNNSGETK